MERHLPLRPCVGAWGVLALLLAGQLADWSSTMWALSTGGFRRETLQYGWSCEALTASKGAAILVMVLIAVSLPWQEGPL